MTLNKTKNRLDLARSAVAGCVDDLGLDAGESASRLLQSRRPGLPMNVVVLLNSSNLEPPSLDKVKT
jgi:hypothetical protein